MNLHFIAGFVVLGSSLAHGILTVNQNIAHVFQIKSKTHLHLIQPDIGEVLVLFKVLFNFY